MFVTSVMHTDKLACLSFYNESEHTETEQIYLEWRQLIQYSVENVV